MNGPRRFDLSRLLAVGVLISSLFGVLVIRLARLQLVHSEMYLKQSETNRVRILEKPPLRGLMLDRNGRLMVDNYPSYTLLAVPQMLDQNDQTRDTLLALTGLDEEEFNRRLHRIPKNRYTPVRIMRDLDFPTLASLEERRARMPGIMFRVESKRAYPTPVAPHTLGHIGELKEEAKEKYPNQQSGDIVGLAGLEEQWNDVLMGRKGVEYLEVDALGRVVGPLSGVKPIPPESGSDLVLTIDLDLQLRAEELLGEQAGAVVALEPQTGEVLAIASKPDYPPETFAGLLTPDNWRQLQEDENTPLLHRAVQGLYPPGSIFKMSVLTAGLQTETITTSWKVTCNGVYQLGRRPFRCWNRGGHGEVDHELSIEASCDIFYYLLGNKMGIDKFHDQISHFGFGQVTGIDLPHESSGLLPGRDFMDRRYGENRWTSGHLFNISIGQGDVLVTPLQSAVFAAALANGGWWLTPHLVREVKQPDGTVIPSEEPERHETGFDPEILTLVRDDMLLVTEGSHGTAHWLYDPRMHVAGKTGTSQNSQGEDHALFIAFAPFENPEIAVAVVVEHGEHGSTAAAPIAMKLIRQHLGLDDETWQRYRWKIIADRRRAQAQLQPEGPTE
ncbi:penicillin-binding protein 2 [bacterium]|nr:penicillin-binding protein 2 [bacterium]